MADEIAYDKALDKRQDAARWLVGMALGGFAGAISLLDKIATDDYLRFGWMAVIALMAFTLFLGVFLVLAIVRTSDRLSKFHAVWQASPHSAAGSPAFNPDAVYAGLEVARDDFHGRLTAAQNIYWWTILGFIVALAVATVSLCVLAFPRPQPQPDPPPAAPRCSKFTILPSGTHHTRAGLAESHTLMLCESTGEVWQMICDGKIVQFKRVKVEDLKFRDSLESTP